ncbi:MAG TPA: carcinine hydrolase/isopenicillin-N N-acyltransferase family protein, partial [Polyangiaceae bacterium]|nr:carcinine hydrolase/isopenicillin-N N-acyltransferase family protein [Polyangiaceae bacterium]
RFLVLRRSRPDDAAASLSVTYPAMVGAIAGVNQHGLALTVNQAFATDIDRRKAALLVTLLAQECLDACHDVAEAVQLIKRTPVTNGGLLTPVDASGARAVVELSATRRKPRLPSDDAILYAFNKYLLPELQHVEVPVGAITTGIGAGYDIHATNIERERRYLEILRDGHAYSQNDIRALLADHDNGSGGMNTICCHGDALNMTIMHALIDPRARAIKLIVGRTCQGEYELHALDTRAAAEETQRGADSALPAV